MKWIPVTERLPNLHEDVLISYRYKQGEGDQSHVHITITSMSDHNPFWVNLKTEPYWIAPFQYFDSNYEVVAWMPLPDPYKPVRHGMWEMKPDPYGFFDEIPVCSECGCTPKMREKSKYCPNCGCQMDLDEVEE